MLANYGLIYRDNLEPECAETRRWFQENMSADTVVAWSGQMWRVDKVETHYDFKQDGPGIHEFVVEGSYI